MEVTYRCMTCGNNIISEQDKYPKCNSCNKETILLLVTEENKDRLPFPTNPIGMEDPSKSCQCKAGTCPCGKFVAHRIDEPCNSNEFLQLESEAQK